MSKALPKIWRIESSDGMRVVRITSAGIILSDAANVPTLFDYHTARSVADNLEGIMSLERFIVTLVPKPQEPKTRNEDDTKTSHKVSDRQPDKHATSSGT